MLKNVLLQVSYPPVYTVICNFKHVKSQHKSQAASSFTIAPKMRWQTWSLIYSILKISLFNVAPINTQNVDLLFFYFEQSFAELVHSGGIIYTVEEENCEDQEQKLHLPLVQQHLLLFLFLQYSDPFTSQLSDIMGKGQLYVIRCVGLRLISYPWSSSLSYRDVDRAPPRGCSEQQ